MSQSSPPGCEPPSGATPPGRNRMSEGVRRGRRKDAGGGEPQADARTHAATGSDEDGNADEWEEVLARAVAEDDFATIACAIHGNQEKRRSET